MPLICYRITVPTLIYPEDRKIFRSSGMTPNVNYGETIIFSRQMAISVSESCKTRPLISMLTFSHILMS